MSPSTMLFKCHAEIQASETFRSIEWTASVAGAILAGSKELKPRQKAEVKAVKVRQ